jgi:hypothetical protein
MQTSLIQNAHGDLVTDAAYDFYGVCLATCPLDHRIKIWQLDESDGPGQRVGRSNWVQSWNWYQKTKTRLSATTILGGESLTHSINDFDLHSLHRQ